MLTVVCYQWFDPKGRWNDSFLYTADHVLRLRRMVCRNLAEPHRFVCVTNQPEHLEDQVETLPVSPGLMALGHRWPKLTIFDPSVAERVGERVLTLDLDCVITGQLDPIIPGPNDPTEFKIWADRSQLTPYNSSMIYMRTGARRQVWDQFKGEASIAQIERFPYLGTDQKWIAVVLGQDEETWTTADGVLSMKRDVLRQKNPLRRFRNQLPKRARIVFFHGAIDPSMPCLQEKYPWIKEHWR